MCCGFVLAKGGKTGKLCCRRSCANCCAATGEPRSPPIGYFLARIRANPIFRACRQAASSAGIAKSVHPHLFRHAFATHLLETGVNLCTIQILLGHANLTTTARYLQVADVHVRGTTSPLESLESLRLIPPSGLRHTLRSLSFVFWRAAKHNKRLI